MPYEQRFEPFRVNLATTTARSGAPQLAHWSWLRKLVSAHSAKSIHQHFSIKNPAPAVALSTKRASTFAGLGS